VEDAHPDEVSEAADEDENMEDCSEGEEVGSSANMSLDPEEERRELPPIEDVLVDINLPLERQKQEVCKLVIFHALT
jgi:hypothetical protein